MLGDIAMYRRYAVGFRSYLKRPLGEADCAALLGRQRSSYEEGFLRVLGRAVYANQRSPYRRLLGRAGIEHGDVVKLVRDHGLQAALERLYDAGVHFRLNEVKGRQPVDRPGLQLPVSEHDFDNPLLLRHFEARSGGSPSAGKGTVVDLCRSSNSRRRSSRSFATRLISVVALWRRGTPLLRGSPASGRCS